jgi:hypothetical protein
MAASVNPAAVPDSSANRGQSLPDAGVNPSSLALVAGPLDGQEAAEGLWPGVLLGAPGTGGSTLDFSPDGMTHKLWV